MALFSRAKAIVSYLWGAVAGAAIFIFGTKAKNSVEEIIITQSDSFTRWDSLFKQFGAEYGVNWQILKAIAMNESDLGEAASVKLGLAEPWNIEGSKSFDGKSWGLMQFTLPTAKDMDPTATVARLNDPNFSIRIAAKYVKWLSNQFGPLEYVVKSYNQGPGNTKKEIAGTGGGFADAYWDRFNRNLKIIQNKQGV